MAIGTIAGLSYWYPGSAEPALREVSTDLLDGLTVVAGPSGGGKSTFLRVLNGLVPHFHGGSIAGRAWVLGSNIVETPTRNLARSVGFVFQDPELQTVYNTVDREVAFGLENVGVPTRLIAGQVQEALRVAGILHLAGRTVRTLSGGERQRVALASSLAMTPRLVVLDEPTSQLDPDGASLLLAAAARLVDEGRAVIVSEHRLDRLLKLATALLLIEGGRVERADPASWRPSSTASTPARRASSGSEMWSLDGVTAGFNGQPVIEDAHLAGRSGEVVVLNGPNGGGKTTLLRLIAGSLAPLAGTVRRRPGRIAYLPQNPTALLHRPTLRAEVKLTLERSGDRERPEEILDALGLLHVADRYPRDLSTGERQRAALAAVLPGSPALVLLDEPTRGMDVAARDALVGLVTRLRGRGAAIVLATHDSDLTLALADRIAHVASGRVRETPVAAVQK